MVFEKEALKKVATDDSTWRERKALPELLLKQQIAINDRGLLIHSFKVLERNRRLNNGQISQFDKSMFESELCGLFLDIKTMIKCRRKWESMAEFEKSQYNKLVRLVNGESKFKLSELVSMMNYLLNMLHDLNLTNLLISEKDPFEDWKTEY